MYTNRNQRAQFTNAWKLARAEKQKTKTKQTQLLETL